MTDADRWELVRSVIPWVETLLTRFKVDSEDRDDVRSFTYLYLFDRAHGYDPEKGATTTWSRWQVRGAVNEYRKMQRVFGPKSLHRAPWRRVDTVDEDEGIKRRYSSMDVGVACQLERRKVLLLAPTPDFEGEIDERHLPGRVAIELARLPAREATAIVQSASGMHLADIGGPMGVSRERARQLKERGLQRVREALGL